ncbi:MAG: hypothetical protein ACUVXG_10260 [Anaerolineae bacterium]
MRGKEGPRSPQQGFDPRKHWAQTQARLILGGFAILLGVGGGLIGLLYGPGEAVAGISCLLAFMGLFGALWGLLKLMELWVGEES